MANDAAMAEAVRQRGWVGYQFEVVELVEADEAPDKSKVLPGTGRGPPRSGVEGMR